VAVDEQVREELQRRKCPRVQRQRRDPVPLVVFEIFKPLQLSQGPFFICGPGLLIIQNLECLVHLLVDLRVKMVPWLVRLLDKDDQADEGRDADEHPVGERHPFHRHIDVIRQQHGEPTPATRIPSARGRRRRLRTSYGRARSTKAAQAFRRAAGSGGPYPAAAGRKAWAAGDERARDEWDPRWPARRNTVQTAKAVRPSPSPRGSPSFLI